MAMPRARPLILIIEKAFCLKRCRVPILRVFNSILASISQALERANNMPNGRIPDRRKIAAAGAEPYAYGTSAVRNRTTGPDIGPGPAENASRPARI